MCDVTQRRKTIAATARTIAATAWLRAAGWRARHVTGSVALRTRRSDAAARTRSGGSRTRQIGSATESDSGRNNVFDEFDMLYATYDHLEYFLLFKPSILKLLCLGFSSGKLLYML